MYYMYIYIYIYTTTTTTTNNNNNNNDTKHKQLILLFKTCAKFHRAARNEAELGAPQHIIMGGTITF